MKLVYLFFRQLPVLSVYSQEHSIKARLKIGVYIQFLLERGLTVSNKKQYHVSKNKNEGWKVTKGGKSTSQHKTQGNAIKQAIKQAKKTGGEVVTHGRDGKIRSKDSYGNDPNPPKDTEN